MIIVEPSFEIQDELDQSSLVIRLEACGRICYKSEDKITEESAMPFVSRIAAHGHNSVLEMAVVTLKITCDQEKITALYRVMPKFIFLDEVDGGAIVTGSVRAYRELYLFHREVPMVNAMVTFLAHRHPYLFQGVYDKEHAAEVDPRIDIKKIRLEDVEKLDNKLLLRHRHVGVKFTVNRAVTHELVRHRPCSYLQESQRYCRYNQDKFDNQVTFIKPLFFDDDSEGFARWKKAMEETERIYLELLEKSSPQAARTVLPNSCKTEIIAYCNLVEWKHIFSQRTIAAAEPSMREVMIPLSGELSKRFPAMNA